MSNVQMLVDKKISPCYPSFTIQENPIGRVHVRHGSNTHAHVKWGRDEKEDA